MPAKKAFTLIELLVVIAIIGILSTLAIVAYQSAQARARDARRLSDVKEITTALSMYLNEASIYPATLAASSTLSYNGDVFMQEIPVPPTPDDGCVGSNQYSYTPQGPFGAYNSYSLQYCLGAANNQIPAGLNTATPSGMSSH